MAVKEKYEYQQERSGTTGALFWIFTTAAALVLLIVFAIPLLLQDGGEQNTGIVFSNVVDNPQQYAGQVIAFRGEVDQTLGSRGFTIDDPGSSTEKMLVVSKQPLEAVGGSGTTTALFSQNDDVVVSGTVRQFYKDDLEDELGIMLTDDQYAQYEGMYIFFADTVTKTDK